MRDVYCHHRDGSIRHEAPKPVALLPGSFNPLHHGHITLAQVAATRLGGEVHFELSITNAEKPELPAEEVARRLTPFVGLAPVWVTRAWSFAMKAELFPGTAFVLGYDTATRLIDPRFYDGDPARRDSALARFHELGCRFVVGGRVDAVGHFRVWDEDAVEPEHRDLFLALTPADFRIDISSTELRRRGG